MEYDQDYLDPDHDLKVGFVLGALGMMALIFLIDYLPFTTTSIYNKAIKECEKQLPRDKHCKIIGVPKEE